MLKKKFFPIFLLLLVMAPVALADTAPQSDYGINPATVDMTKILAPPPPIDSAAGKADLKAVQDAKKNLTQTELNNAKADNEVSVFRFSDVIGTVFTVEKLPKTAKFFAQVRAAASPTVKIAKDYFKRQRPFHADSQIDTPIGKPDDFSYPSGHSTFAYVVGIILANMLPDKKSEIFDRAGVYAHNRVVVGVHYPTDVEGGRISGSVIDNVMLHNGDFKHDYKESCAEVRHALSLPEQPVCNSLD